MKGILVEQDEGIVESVEEDKLKEEMGEEEIEREVEIVN